MRPKRTHAEPIQPVMDGERHGFLYRWNTGDLQVMWISVDDSNTALPGRTAGPLDDMILEQYYNLA